MQSEWSGESIEIAMEFSRVLIRLHKQSSAATSSREIIS